MLNRYLLLVVFLLVSCCDNNESVSKRVNSSEFSIEVKEVTCVKYNILEETKVSCSGRVLCKVSKIDNVHWCIDEVKAVWFTVTAQVSLSDLPLECENNRVAMVKDVFANYWTTIDFECRPPKPIKETATKPEKTIGSQREY